MTTEDYVKDALSNKNASPLKRNQYNSALNVGDFKPEFSADFGSNFTSQFATNPDLDTSNGLYRLAEQTGFKKQADKILFDNSGESTNKIFSGGFISDTFDLLNIFSYGMVGLAKGKSFSEGVTNRESFSDKDSLGQYGAMGIVGGLVLDIALDPFTYIAPWTILKKVPGVTRVGMAIKDATIGREITKLAPGAEQAYTTLEGGFKDGKARDMLQKMSYMFGADASFAASHEHMIAMIGKETGDAMKMIEGVSKLDPKAVGELLVKDNTGRFQRQSLTDLQRTLSSEAYAKVEPIWNTIDSLGKRMVDLGLLGSEKFEENLGKYVKSVYAEHELASKKGFFGFGKVKVGPQKARDLTLTEENMKQLGQIADPAYVTGKTMLTMIHDIHNAEFLNKVAKFSSATEFEGSVLIKDTRKYMTTQGADAEARMHITDINKKITPLLKELKITHSADRKVMSEINAIEKEIGALNSKSAFELFKVNHEGELGSTLKVIKGVAHRPMPNRLEPLAEMLRKFDTFEEAVNSRAGIEMQKLWNDGVLFRNGFGKLVKKAPGVVVTGGEQAMRDFFDSAKKLYTPGTMKRTVTPMVGNVPRIQELSQKIEKLLSKSEDLKDLDKTSINNSFINLERQLSELSFDKEDLIASIHNNKLAGLAGRYLPKEMAQYIDEIVNPTEAFGNKIISEFKYMKVVLSPATHIRNIMSNRILNWWKLGVGPWRADLDLRVMKELKSEGKMYQEWKSVGGGADTYAAQELKSILEQPETTYLKGKLGKAWTKTKKKLGDVYQSEESYAKMTAFIAMRDKGYSIQEAYKMSESATFNYAQVTPMIKKMRTALWGVPFITFAVKSSSVALETIAKHPGRVSVFGKIRNDIKNASDIKETEAEAQSEPAWVKDGFAFKLPYKDKYGRSMYFDLTYILPFGDIVTGGIFQQGTMKKSGTKEALPVSIASNNPVFQFLKEVTRNETFTGEKIFKESGSNDEVIADLLRHVARTFTPPTISAQIPSGYNQNTGELAPSGVNKSLGASKENQSRTLGEEMASYLGFKVQPTNASINETYQEYNKKKALQTLMLENNIIKSYQRNYIPKD